MQLLMEIREYAAAASTFDNLWVVNLHQRKTTTNPSSYPGPDWYSELSPPPSPPTTTRTTPLFPTTPTTISKRTPPPSSNVRIVPSGRTKILKYKELLIRTCMAVEEISSVAKTMLDEWNGNTDDDDGQEQKKKKKKKKICSRLKLLFSCLNQININVQKSFYKLSEYKTLAITTMSRIKSET
jgi:hypothetical protein